MNRMKSIYTFAFLISFSCLAQTREEFVIKFKQNTHQEQMTSYMRHLSNINNWHYISKNANHPLSNIVRFSSSSFNINQWKSNSNIEYIEQLPQTFFATDTLPSDPYHSFQWENTYVHAPFAWNLLETNDTSFLVGMVDSGTDFDHEDLQNFYVNTNDPINGLDDDNNGLVDDHRGWDFGEYDNDPSVPADIPHGRQMTSLVAAETNNGTGMSALSYNVKYITAKISADDGQIFDPYEGIVYVVDQGAKVVNCSWYQNVHTKYGKDIIDYALSKDVVVVSSAGNDNSNTPVFPASYEYVLGVGAIDENGLKTNVSNFGNWVDIFAPGQNLYVAYPNNTYFTTGGTSTSTALTTSACCLLRKLFPNETAQQIITRVKRTGSPIANTDISGKYINLKQASAPTIVTDFQIFPNPSQSGDVSIDIPFATDNSAVTLEVYNMLGQLVHSAPYTMQNGQKTIQTTLNLANGQYIISVEAENIKKTTKFTLAR